MRTRKAFIAGFGTTGALMAATVCMFTVVSAIVAFEGWPSLHLGRPITTLEGDSAPVGDTGLALAGDMAGGRATGQRADRSHRISALGERPVHGSGEIVRSDEEQAVVKAVSDEGAPASADPQSPAAHGSGQGDVGGDDGGSDSTPSDPTPSAPPPAQSPSGDGSTPGPAGDGGLGDTVGQTTSGLGTTVGQTGAALGTTVGTATGQVGTVVGQVSPALGQTIAQTGQTVGGVVTGTTGAVGQVVQGTGGVLGGLVGGLGGHRTTAHH